MQIRSGSPAVRDHFPRSRPRVPSAAATTGGQCCISCRLIFKTQFVPNGRGNNTRARTRVKFCRLSPFAPLEQRAYSLAAERGRNGARTRPRRNRRILARPRRPDRARIPARFRVRARTYLLPRSAGGRIVVRHYQPSSGRRRASRDNIIVIAVVRGGISHGRGQSQKDFNVSCFSITPRVRKTNSRILLFRARATTKACIFVFRKM